jgi:hypothetical protein
MSAHTGLNTRLALVGGEEVDELVTFLEQGGGEVTSCGGGKHVTVFDAGS